MQLVDLLYEIGRWSLEGLWLPLFIWTAIALPLALGFRFASHVPAHARYRGSLAVLASLPLGILAAAISAFESPAVRDVTALVSLPAITTTAASNGAEDLVWTTYHTAGAAVAVAALLAILRFSVLVAASIQLARYRRGVTLETPSWLADMTKDLRDQLGLRRNIDVAVSDVASPLTFGFRSPLVLLPRKLLASPEDLRLALMHELIHVYRHDYLLQWIEQVVGALFYVHPLVALVRQDVSVLREITCDADVLVHTRESRPRYARLLYQYAAPSSSRLDLAVGIVLREHHLTKRIESMKDFLDFSGANRSKRTSILIAALVLTVALVAVACSDLLVHPTPANNEPAVASTQADETYVIVEDMPELIGGLQSIQENLRYPELAKKAGIEGRVIVQFVVDEEGSVVDPRIVRGLGSGLDEAALAAVRTAKFEPGTQRGEAVKVKMSLPITFMLGSSQAARTQDGAQSRADLTWEQWAERAQEHISHVERHQPTQDKDGHWVSVDQMPELIGGLSSIQKNLHYPKLAKDAGVEGRVIVEFVVDKDGEVVDARIVRGLGSGLDEAALEAVRSAKFTPGKKEGEPVPVKLSLPVTFKLG